jgi:hypothetical protein
MSDIEMNEIETHINKLFEKITDSKRKRELMLEITQNLNEKVSALVDKGLTREQAVNKAIEDFGDIDDLKDELESSGKLAKSKNAGLSLAFSVWGALLIIGLFLFINLYYTPEFIWFVFPVFAVLWWPMAMFFRWLHLKNNVPIGLPFSICSFIPFWDSYYLSISTTHRNSSGLYIQPSQYFGGPWRCFSILFG